MYRGFTGRDPDIQPYLEYYGLAATGAPPAATPAPEPAPAAAPQPANGERGR
jgi:hypothetical protein